MNPNPRAPRAVEQRKALGRRIRAYRLALGLASRDVAAHIGTSHSQMTSIETTSQDVLVGTLIDVAGAVGLDVALVAEHHLPLLDLTANEIDAIRDALTALVNTDAMIGPLVASALDKLTREQVPA